MAMVAVEVKAAVVVDLPAEVEQAQMRIQTSSTRFGRVSRPSLEINAPRGEPRGT